MAAWLLLAAGDNRQHGGNEGYADDPAISYTWDDTVPHHAAIRTGDYIALWDKHTLLGASVVEVIEVGDDTKQIHRCPMCGKAGIKPRRTQTPRFKCYKCGETFDEPRSRAKRVRTYASRHGVGWVDLEGRLSGAELRELCERPRSQLSLRPLKWDAFVAALREVGERLDVLETRARQLGGGHGTATVRVRRGQGQFREELLANFGEVCAVTGSAPRAVLEACHLYSYGELGEHHIDGGLLLRRDVHRLFDLGHLAVDPETLRVDVADTLLEFGVYGSLEGRELCVPLADGHRRWLAKHWTAHRS